MRSSPSCGGLVLISLLVCMHNIRTTVFTSSLGEYNSVDEKRVDQMLFLKQSFETNKTDTLKTKRITS